MLEADLIARHHRLLHVAHPDAWPSIIEDGLLSTSALLDRYRVTGPVREAIEARPRPSDVTLLAQGLPLALMRDQRLRVRLSRINTGYAMRRPARRGPMTFQPISAFKGTVKEFTVEGSIPDFAELVSSTDGSAHSLLSRRSG